MAKLIELSFVTSFVAFLGQVLSRRAFMKEQGRGVTLSELSMWRWVVQPGTLVRIISSRIEVLLTFFRSHTGKPRDTPA
jgi:hypothetical protein